jgi:hypothetical protein
MIRSCIYKITGREQLLFIKNFLYTVILSTAVSIISIIIATSILHLSIQR